LVRIGGLPTGAYFKFLRIGATKNSGKDKQDKTIIFFQDPYHWKT